MAPPAEEIIGRAAELRSLDDAVAELVRRRPGALELAGEPGIAKTRLLTELGARAERRGHLVLSGSASEFERELPFSIFADALDDYVHALEPRRVEAVDDDARADLAHVLPSTPAPATRDRPARDERLRTHRAVRGLLEVLAASKPLVLLLDDVHWADSGSIELLGSLLRRPPTAPVLMAVALRPRQAAERLSAVLERARRAGALTRIELSTLSREEAGELVGATGATAVELYGQWRQPVLLPAAHAGDGCGDVPR